MDDEPVSLMEPLMPRSSESLAKVVWTLLVKTGGLVRMLHPRVQTSLGNLVRSMNCYYSNFIEGHDTHPRDIDRALARDFSTQPRKRRMQKEAAAHIEVQRMIDHGEDPKVHPASREYILWLHREFCERLPGEMLRVTNPDSDREVQIIPGRFRDGDVTVRRHLAPRPGNLDRFMTRFEEGYASDKLSQMEQLIAVGAAHHRLLWIHPFYDFNGRVTRLMSHAMLLRLEIGNPLWSVARGLARNVDAYRSKLEQADEERRSDTDGRGSLSEDGLVEFCRFFLETARDQVEFMTSLLEPGELENRVRIYVEEEIGAKRLLKGSFELLREALRAGSFPRGEAPEITGFKARWARQCLSRLVERKLLVSRSPKGDVQPGFPLDVVERWFPKLYPAVAG